MYLGAVQLIPTPITCSQDSAIKAQSSVESPLATLAPSLHEKENQAGMSMPASSRSSAYACHMIIDKNQVPCFIQEPA